MTEDNSEKDPRKSTSNASRELEAIAGFVPQWRELTEAEKTSFPYAAIGSLHRTSDGLLIGTAWILRRNLAITAAHAIQNSAMELRLPGGGGPIAVVAPAIPHPSAVRPPTAALDRHDLAALKLGQDANAEPLPICSSMSPSGTATVPGHTSDGKYVVHDGIFALADDNLLLHKGDTERGHSGAPVLCRTGSNDWEVIALHVGGPSLHDVSEFSFHNTTLQLSGNRREFLVNI